MKGIESYALNNQNRPPFREREDGRDKPKLMYSVTRLSFASDEDESQWIVNFSAEIRLRRIHYWSARLTLLIIGRTTTTG